MAGLGLVLIVVAVLAGVVWPLGWLVVEAWRDRTRARRAAQEAWHWLLAQECEQAWSPGSVPPDRGGGPEVVVRRRVPVRG